MNLYTNRVSPMSSDDFRTPREELLGQKITFMYLENLKVTLGVYDVNKKYFGWGGSSYEPCKNSL